MNRTPSSENRWLIRVASRRKDGGGHMRRCAALASELARQSVTAIFVLDEPSAVWSNWLERRGFSTVAEGAEPCGLYAGAVLDHYEDANARAVRYKSLAGWVAAMDDFGVPPPAADLAIHPAADLVGDDIGAVPALCGPRYALLPSEYGDEPPPPRAVAERILISFGLLDSSNVTGTTLDSLKRIIWSGRTLDIDVVLPISAPHSEVVRGLASRIGATYHGDIDDLRPLLIRSDLAIGAGGVGLYERLALAIPTVTIATTPNQQGAVDGAARMGATVTAGSAEGVDPNSLAAIIASLLEDGSRRRALATRGRQLVDGHGAARVATALINRAAAAARMAS